MKTTFLSIALLALGLGGLQAQNTVTVTNYVTVVVTNTDSVTDLMPTNDAPEYGKIDFTVSSAGSSYGGVNQAGVDFSVSVDPFEKLPDLWVGVSQSLYWAPAFGGSTDVDADWNIGLTDKFCVQGGWSAGYVYGAGANNLFRTGPEVIAQYYISDDVYLYGAVNYDLLTLQNGQGWQTTSTDNNGIRWSIGIGVEL